MYMKKILLISALCLLCSVSLWGQQVRLASYNVHNCIGMDNVRDYQRIANIIRQTGADVVAPVFTRWPNWKS